MSDKDKLELTKKLGIFGLSDLRRIAPIGNLGYMNGWYGHGKGAWMNGGLERSIMRAFNEQREKFGFKTEGHSTGYRQTDHHTYCSELGLSWSVDSGD